MLTIWTAIYFLLGIGISLTVVCWIFVKEEDKDVKYSTPRVTVEIEEDRDGLLW